MVKITQDGEFSQETREFDTLKEDVDSSLSKVEEALDYLENNWQDSESIEYISDCRTDMEELKKQNANAKDTADALFAEILRLLNIYG